MLSSHDDDDDLRDRMSAVECLEHKWLSESSRPLKNCTKEDSTIAETIITATVTATTAAAATENTNSIPIEKHSTVENNSNGSTIIIDTNKSREADGVSCATSSSSSSASPAKPNTGFFLHQTPKNGTTLDEVLFSSLNNGFNTTAHTRHHHHHHHLQQHHHHNHSNHQHHHHHSNHQSVEHAKQNAPTVNNSCSSSMNPNDTTDLLKDYATNKENINLSKILANRSSAAVAAAAANRTTLHNNNINSNTGSSNGSSTNNNSNSGNNTSATTYEYADESVTMSATTNGTTAQAKHESILFPDAPTTPKVLRKSNQADGETPACVTLVKQFQLNNGTTATATAAVATETVTVPMSSSTSPSSTTVQATTMRNKFANLTELARENYRISAAAITTTVAANGHHHHHHQHHHHSLGSSALSSALSINTLTESSVGVSQQHSNSTITISTNCLCGADKTANCCCNSSSRAALNYRKKSLAVVDSSILC